MLILSEIGENIVHFPLAMLIQIMLSEALLDPPVLID